MTMTIEYKTNQNTSTFRKIIGVIGSLLILGIGAFVLFALSIGIAVGNSTLLMTFSTLIGVMIIIIILIYFLLRVTWNNKLALKALIILSAAPLLFTIWFFGSVIFRYLIFNRYG